MDGISCVGTAGPSALWVAQPTTLCATDEGLAATLTPPHCPAALPSSQENSMLSWGCVSKGPTLLASASVLHWAGEGVRDKT